MIVNEDLKTELTIGKDDVFADIDGRENFGYIEFSNLHDDYDKTCVKIIFNSKNSLDLLLDAITYLKCNISTSTVCYMKL